MPCLVCTHPRHEALLAALPVQPLRELEAQYGISRSVLSRHRRQGCAAVTPRRAPDRTAGDLQPVVELLEAIRELLLDLVALQSHHHPTNGTAGNRRSGGWNQL